MRGGQLSTSNKLRHALLQLSHRAHVPPRTVAAIDVGSNSIHITVARVAGATIRVVAAQKRSARLGAALTRHGILTDDTVAHVIDILKTYKALAESHGAQIRASATAALRSARNRLEVVQRIRNEAQVDVQIISEGDEARLVRAGVLHGLPDLFDQDALCVDVGGGSTEMSAGRGGAIRLIASVPTGALLVHKRYLGFDTVTRRAVTRAQTTLSRRFQAYVGPFRRAGMHRAIGTGGSIQRIARMAKMVEGQPVEDVHGYVMSAELLRHVVDTLIKSETPATRRTLPGIDADRADVLLGGALIFQVLTDAFEVEQWTVSMSALRTGLLILPDL
ncbi:MAG: hypothetical protein VX589_12240 [Myxococcota bacterium]|nr:hypothetical protein [Myxococcota bacterium]